MSCTRATGFVLFLTLVSLLLGVGSAGCSTNPDEVASPRPDGLFASLADAEAGEIFALHPYPWQLEQEQREREEAEAPTSEDANEDLHGYRILGRAQLASASDRNHLLALIEKGIEDSDGTVAACFNPRHGIRIVKGGVVTELVICFECLSLHVYKGGVQSGSETTSIRYSRAVTALFERHGLELHRDE